MHQSSSRRTISIIRLFLGHILVKYRDVSSARPLLPVYCPDAGIALISDLVGSLITVSGAFPFLVVKAGQTAIPRDGLTIRVCAPGEQCPFPSCLQYSPGRPEG